MLAITQQCTLYTYTLAPRIPDSSCCCCWETGKHTSNSFHTTNNDDEDDSYENYVKSWVGQIEPINLKFQIRLLSDKIRVYRKEQLFGHFCSFLFNGPSKKKCLSYKLKFLHTTYLRGRRWGLSEVRSGKWWWSWWMWQNRGPDLEYGRGTWQSLMMIRIWQHRGPDLGRREAHGPLLGWASAPLGDMNLHPPQHILPWWGWWR